MALGRQRSLKAGVVREQLARLAGLDVDVTVEPVPGDQEGLRWRTRQRYAVLPDGRLGMRKHRSHEVVPVEDCLLEAPTGPTFDVRGVRFEIADGGFWQVHPGAPEALVGAVLEALQPRPGDTVLDLYAGAGLFSRFLRDTVGSAGRVVAVEGDAAASALGERNCPGVEVMAGDVTGVLATSYKEAFDLVVLDPPRAGAKAEAGQFAAAELAEAREKLALADNAVKEESMVAAERFARESRVQAELASARTATAKTAAVNKEMERGADALSEEMQRAGESR